MGILDPCVSQLQSGAETPQLKALCSCRPASDPLWIKSLDIWAASGKTGSGAVALGAGTMRCCTRGGFAARAFFFFFFSPYQLFSCSLLRAAGVSNARCSSLPSSSSSWKLSAGRPAAASVSRFGSVSAGSSCSCRHPSRVGQVRKFRAILKYQGALLRRATCVGFLSLPNMLRCFEARA